MRRAASVERLASTTIAAWWRSTRESRRYRRARISAVTIQSVVRGGRGRVEAAALWMALGRRFSKDKAATIIQVRGGLDAGDVTGVHRRAWWGVV